MQNGRPNVLLILADDVGTGEVPGYWNTGLVDMPNLRSLVQHGVRFKDAHSTPLCSPSRYVLLSGNYQHRGHLYPGTWKVNYKSGQFRHGQQSIADVLRSEGNYETGMMGKWHMGGKLNLKDVYHCSTNLFMLQAYSCSICANIQVKSPQKIGTILVEYCQSLLMIQNIYYPMTNLTGQSP